MKAVLEGAGSEQGWTGILAGRSGTSYVRRLLFASSLPGAGPPDAAFKFV